MITCHEHTARNQVILENECVQADNGKLTMPIGVPISAHLIELTIISEG